MKIEAGKYYTTRDGRKAFVDTIVGGSPFMAGCQPIYPVIGYIEDEDSSSSWMIDGVASFEVGGERDLIREYREPEKVVRWVHMWRDKDGVFVGNIHPRKMDHAEGDSPSELIARKRIEITEGTFDE